MFRHKILPLPHSRITNLKISAEQQGTRRNIRTLTARPGLKKALNDEIIVGRLSAANHKDASIDSKPKDVEQTITDIYDVRDKSQRSSSLIMIETEILKEKDPKENDWNNWPTYELTEVVVEDPKTGQLTSLLSADAQVPLNVTGILSEVKEEYKNNLILPEALGNFIQLKDVRTYCHAPQEGGSVSIFAAAKSGWFLVVPGKQYKAIHDQMVQDINLLYYVEDFYDFANIRGKSGRKKLRGSAEDLFARYARENADCQDADAAKALFYDRRDFLIAAMLKTDSDKPWTRTSFHGHLKRLFPGDFKRIEGLKEITQTIAEDNGNQPVAPVLSKTSLGSQITNKHKSKYRYIWSRIKDSRRDEEILLSNMTVETFGRILYRDHEIESPEVGAKVIQSYGPELLRLMSGHKTTGFDWTKRRIYKQLTQLGQPDLHLQSYRCVILRPRQQALNIHLQSSQETRAREDVAIQIVEGDNTGHQGVVETNGLAPLRDEPSNGDKQKVKSEDKTVHPEEFVKQKSVKPARLLPAEDSIKTTDATRKRSRDSDYISENSDQMKTRSSLTYNYLEVNASNEESIEPVVSRKRRLITSPSPLQIHNNSLTDLNPTPHKQKQSSKRSENSHLKSNSPKRKQSSKKSEGDSHHLKAKMSRARYNNTRATSATDSVSEVDEELELLTLSSPPRKKSTVTLPITDEDEEMENDDDDNDDDDEAMELVDMALTPRPAKPPAKPEPPKKSNSPPPLPGITPWWEKKKKQQDPTTGILIQKPLPQTLYDKNTRYCPWTCQIAGCYRRIWHADTLEGQLKIEQHLELEHYKPERERRKEERKWNGDPDKEMDKEM